MSYLVAVYDCNLLKGGYEEGGWWYDAGELVRVVRVFRSEDRAYKYSSHLNRRLQSRTIGPNQGKRDYHSVLSDGEYRAQVCEGNAPEYFPLQRPTYC